MVVLVVVEAVHRIQELVALAALAAQRVVEAEAVVVVLLPAALVALAVPVTAL